MKVALLLLLSTLIWDLPLAYGEMVIVTPETYSGVDSLGRRVVLAGEAQVSREKNSRQVGIFYFLWHGEHGTQGPYDINKILAEYPDAPTNIERWGGYGVYHWWGEPLFGYYTNRDEWVMRKHIELLTDAGVDFVVFDTTNRVIYHEAVLRFMGVLNEYYEQGFAVPKVAFYTNSDSGRTMNLIYDEIYQKHQQYQHLWYLLDGKPMIIGKPDDPELQAVCREFFRIKKSQWPNEYDRNGRFLNHDDGFPWISFEQPQHLFDAVSPAIMNVSVAQHSGTVAFSSTALYGDMSNRTRSWHDGANDLAPGAELYGYNFAGQFEHALNKQPDMIFITSWNEWIAGDWGSGKGDKPLLFVDCCTTNTSRDVEMMHGGYQDNYYLQMLSYIRRFKGAEEPYKATEQYRINFDNGFEDWSQVKVCYRDYQGDTAKRQAPGYGGVIYTNDTGRNDLILARVAHDYEYLYFYLETAEAIRDEGAEGWLNLLLQIPAISGAPDQIDKYMVNRLAPQNGQLILEKSIGNWQWQETGRCDYILDARKLQLRIRLDALGLSTEQGGEIEFKWSDNQLLREKAIEPERWYTDGDSAPNGRLNYIYRF